MISSFCRNTAIGEIEICANEHKLIRITFGRSAVQSVVNETPLITEAFRQVEEYLKGVRRQFDLPLDIQGTDFQKKVWQALQMIPYGRTGTYGELAAQIGNPKASRAVGMANHRNPLPLIVPCHRVIGAGGGLTGFAGGLDIKRRLLELEKENGQREYKP